MNFTRELLADSVVDLKQVIQDALDGKPRPKLTRTDEILSSLRGLQDEREAIDGRIEALEAELDKQPPPPGIMGYCTLEVNL